jgi:hypothetical protein
MQLLFTGGRKREMSGGLDYEEKQERVCHTVRIVYGSYTQDNYKVYCNANDDMSRIKGIITRELQLNFLSMCTYQVAILSTEYLKD